MGIGIGEGILVLLIAALFLRGEEITTAARLIGRWMGQAQRMSRTFMEELQREMGDTGLDDSLKEIRKALNYKKTLKGRTLDQLMDALEGPEGAQEDPGVAAAKAKAAPPAPAPPPSDDTPDSP